MSQQNDILPLGQNYYARVILKNDIEFNSSNIISIVVKEWVFEILPKVEMILKYDSSIFENFLIEDNDPVTILLSNYTNSKSIFKIDCMVHDYKIGVYGDDRCKVVYLTALLKCKNMFNLQTRSFSNKSSYQVLQDIAFDSDLKIKNPLNVNPSDIMTWYQLNQSNYNFIRHVIKRANIINDGLFFYANHNGEFIYTSINKEIDKKVNPKIAKFSLENYSSVSPIDSDSTIWYSSYEIINLQGTFNKKINYGIKSQYYDLERNKMYEIYGSSIYPMANISFIDKEYKNKIVQNYYGGVFNPKNVYNEEYYNAIIRNNIKRNNILGLSFQLNINSISDVNLFDLVILELNSGISDDIDSTWSGYYLITGIIYFVMMNGIFQKRIFISRNGINKPNNDFFKSRNC